MIFFVPVIFSLVVSWFGGFSMRTHNTGVVSSNPARVTIKTPLARKALGNHLIKSTALEKLRTLPLVSAKFKIEYATQIFLLMFKSFRRHHPLLFLPFYDTSSARNQARECQPHLLK